MSFLLEPIFGRSRVRRTKRRLESKLREVTYWFLFQSTRRARHKPRKGHSKQTRRAGEAQHMYGVESPTTSSDDNNTVLSQHRDRNQRLYDTLDHETRMFRLFVLEQAPRNAMITGRLVPWSLDNHPIYQALSYTWSNSVYVDELQQEQPEQFEIHIDREPFFVGANLHEALLCLRNTDQPRHLWIDAICINQHDVEERNHQVGLMKDIYTRADTVIAWLGRSDLHSTISISLIKEINQTANRRKRRRIITRALRDEEYNFEEAYTDIFRRSYWHRTWIIQEIFSAARINLQCGQDVVSWAALVDFQKFLTDECYGNESQHGMDKYHPWTPEISRDSMEEVISEAMRFITLRRLRRSRLAERHGEQPRPLDALLFQHWDAFATDPRDKIFAIFRLASDSDHYNINVDYRLSVNEVYTNVVREYIRQYRNLSIILPNRPQNPAYVLPSWCPDWSWTTPAADPGNFWTDAYPFQTFGRPYDASRAVQSGMDPRFNVQFSPCGQIMMAGGWRLDKVRHHSNMARFQQLQQKRKNLSGLSDILGIFRRQVHLGPSRPSEIDIWYTIHRRALRRGFHADSKRGLVKRGKKSFLAYCKKKHTDFFHVIVRATTLEADEWPEDPVTKKIYSDWKKHRDIPRDGYSHRPNHIITPKLRRSLRDLGEPNVYGSHKCFFTTRSGLMGLGPNGTRRSDIVCILRGCNLPVMLRRDGVYFRLIGACYVVRFMHGQFLDYRRHCGIREETFEIS